MFKKLLAILFLYFLPVVALGQISSASPWKPSAGYLTPVNTTWGLKIPALTNCDTIDTDAAGVFSCGTDDGSASSTYPAAGIALSTGSAWDTSITNNSANWNTAYGWGNHASAGYLTAETDPIFVSASSTFLTSGGTLTTNYHCRYNGTGIDCDRVEDASGACAANAVCMGGHTHVGVNETYGSGWNGDTATPEKDDIYDWGHVFDTDDDSKVNVLDLAAGIVQTDANGVVSLATTDGSGDCGSGAVCIGGHTHPTTEVSGVNAGTDLTADLEEETHAAEHAVGAADTIFPADPNADRYLQWDDDPGALVWAAGAGGLASTDIDTSAELYGILTDETGSASGSPLAVFNVNPVLTGATLAGILADNDDMVFEADADNNGSNKFSFTDGASSEIASITEAGLLTIADDMVITGSDLSIGTAGVKLTGDGDGAITLLGLGDGYDENLVINLDDTENKIVLSSGTSADEIQFSGLDVLVGGGNINTGNIALTIGDGTTDGITLTTDGTGDGEITLPNDSVGENEIDFTGVTAADLTFAEGDIDDSTIVSADIKNGTITAADTALTAGRSLTFSTDDIAADAELYTDTKCIYFENPVATDDFKSVWYAKTAATITSMWCESDQTVNADLQVDDGSAADVNGADLACDATPPEDTSMGGDATLASGDRLDLAIESVSGTPTWVSICWTFTYDD